MGCGATKPASTAPPGATPGKPAFEHVHRIIVRWSDQIRSFQCSVPSSSPVGSFLKVVLSTMNISNSDFLLFVSKVSDEPTASMFIGSVANVEAQEGQQWSVYVNERLIPTTDALSQNILVSTQDAIALVLEATPAAAHPTLTDGESGSTALASPEGSLPLTARDVHLSSALTSDTQLATTPAVVPTAVAPLTPGLALMGAILEGSAVESVQQIVRDEPAVLSYRNEYGATAVHAAVDAGNESALRALIQAGADFKAPDHAGFTPLHAAAEKGFVPTLTALLEAGAPVNVQTADGYTPVYLAAAAGHTDATALLLRAGADANLRARSGSAPLLVALANGHRAVVQQLLALEGISVHPVDPHLQSALHFAALQGYEDVVRELLGKFHCDVNQRTASGLTALHMAATKGHSSLVQYLLQVGADADALTTNGRSPLYAACMAGHLDVVRMLLKKSTAHINTQEATEGNTPLSIACWRGFSEIVTQLLRYGARVDIADAMGLYPVHKAALNDHADTVAAILAQHPNCAAQATPFEQTPLSTAAACGATSTMRLLLSRRPDVDAPDKWGQTPLLRAAAAGQAAACLLLLEAGAQLNARDHDGMTPLLAACAAGRASVVATLCDWPDVDLAAALPSNGDTALHLAGRSGDQATVLALLAARVPSDVRNHEGKLPVQVAQASVTSMMPLPPPSAAAGDDVSASASAPSTAATPPAAAPKTTTPYVPADTPSGGAVPSSASTPVS